MMMDYPLLMKTMLDRSYNLFPEKKVFSRGTVKDTEYNYQEFYQRVQKLANVLQKLGIKKGDCVGTFAWNNHRHMELYFAVPCSGAILHTLNLRLFPEHLIHVINHAEDKIIFIDEDLLPALEKAMDHLKTVEKVVVMSDREELPETNLKQVFSYEKLLKEASSDFVFPENLEETTPAALCYTTATTGLPKGVMYTHRSIYLHSLSLSVPDYLGLSQKDVIMPVVPMFHVLAWGLPFACPWMGADIVLPGRDMRPEALCQLIEEKQVTASAGVPTIWVAMYHHLESGARYDFSSLRFLVNGGSAISKDLIKTFQEKHGIEVLHSYGMTETSPLVTASRLKSHMESWDPESRYEVKAKQGLLAPGLEMKIIDDQGREIKWDGKEMGELCLRGPWIAKEYFRDPERSKETMKNGWLHTGDIVSIDPEGYLQVQDRSKDLIKSGGEWISSVDLENKIMGHPKVMEAAVIAIPDEKWQERPMACIKPVEGEEITEEEIAEYLRDKVAKWWIPDKFLKLEEIPKTSVGKMNKKALREQLVSE